MTMRTLYTSLSTLQILLSLFHTSHSFPISLSFASTRREAIQSTIVSSLTLGMSKLNDTNTINWGIVGIGDVCQKKSGPAFYKCEGSDLAAVMRRTPGKAKEYAAKQVPGGKCVGYEDIDEFLKHPGLDAVYVSTRPGTHLEICKKVAKAGKACYVEKPVGRCAEEAEEINKVFKDAGLKLYTAYISRAYDRTQKVRTLLSEGAIGDTISNVSYTLVGSGGARDMTGDLPWRLDAEQSGGGLIMDVGCHVLDRIDYICGPLTNIRGRAENKHSLLVPVEDFVHLTAEFGEGTWAALSTAKGATVECTWDFASEEQTPFEELQIVGSKGSLKMAGFGDVKVYNEKGELQQELTFDMPEHTAQALIQTVTNDLRGMEKSSILSYGDNAIRTQRVIDTALNSYYGGRESGYWARETWPGRPLQSTA
jgi:1,5-anhydro-D-fructose reductase (1,5-anhydro-D-mannitol-forming)